MSLNESTFLLLLVRSYTYRRNFLSLITLIMHILSLEDYKSLFCNYKIPLRLDFVHY